MIPDSRLGAGSRLDASDIPPAPSWYSRANCRGVNPDLFYPQRGQGTREAKEVCRGCVVREQCLEDAIGRYEKFGIWGGMSERQRRQVRRARALRPSA